MARKPKSNHALKTAARQFQQENPGTPYPEARRAAMRPRSALRSEQVEDDALPEAQLEAYRLLNDRGLFHSHLRAAQVSVTLAMTSLPRVEMGFLPSFIPTYGAPQLFAPELLETLASTGLWRRVETGYQLLDAETLAFAKGLVEEERDTHEDEARICETRGSHLVRNWPPDAEDADDMFCCDCYRCVCPMPASCEFPHTTAELLQAHMDIRKYTEPDDTQPAQGSPGPEYREVPWHAAHR